MFPDKLTVLPDSDPALHSRVPDYDPSLYDPSEVQRVIDMMIQTMREHRGIGLAANQCGLPLRVFVMETRSIIVDDEWHRDNIAAFNPIIELLDDDLILMTEGCLTFPGLALAIKRPARVRLHYQDVLGAEHSIDLDGWSARCAQHEVDHLNGVVFTSLVSKLKLDMARKKLKKR